MRSDYRDEPRSLSENAYMACQYVLTEVKAGLTEGVGGLTSLLTNPVGCLKGIYTMFRHPVLTAQVIGREIYHHPIRFVTKCAFSYVTGVISSAAITGVAEACHLSSGAYIPTAHSVTTATVALEAAKFTLSTAHGYQGSRPFREEHRKICHGEHAKNQYCFFPEARETAEENIDIELANMQTV